MAKPVASLASSAVAFRTSRAPSSSASRPVSARLAPEVRATKGDPSATSTTDFTI